MKTYFYATGAVWLTYLLSIDRAKKEIEKEKQILFEKQINKFSRILIEDSINFISNTLIKTVKPDYCFSKLPKIMNKIPAPKFIKTYHLNVGKLEKIIEQYEEKMNDTVNEAINEKY